MSCLPPVDEVPQPAEGDRVFGAYETLLRRLHVLTTTGQDDSSEADAIRDAMDPLWYKLSPEQAERARQLSADLYALDDDRVAAARLAPR